MASALYNLWKQELMKGTAGTDLTNATATNHPYAALVDSGVYTFSQSHQYADVSLTGKGGTDAEISAPTVVTGTFDGNDVTFGTVAGTVSYEAIVVYRHNTAVTNQPLVMYYDGTGLPITSNGGTISVTWNASGIFTL